MKLHQGHRTMIGYGVAMAVIVLSAFASMHSEQPLLASQAVQFAFPCPTPTPASGGTIPPVYLDKSVNNSYVSPGSPATFTIRINNPCPGIVFAELGITDTLPSGLNLIGTPEASSGNAKVENNKILWSGEVSTTPITLTYAVTSTPGINDQRVTNTVTLYEVRNPDGPTTSETLTDTASVLIKDRWSVHLPMIAKLRPPFPVLANGNLDASPIGSGWTQQSRLGYQLIVLAASVSPGPPAHSLPNIAWLGGANNEGATLTKQGSTLIPRGYDGISLQYYYWIVSFDTCGENKDRAWVEISADGVTKYESSRRLLCRATETHQWVSEAIQIPERFLDKDITVSFHAEFDNVNRSSIFFDTISFCSNEEQTRCAVTSTGAAVDLAGVEDDVISR